jgi:hypothetical protein
MSLVIQSIRIYLIVLVILGIHHSHGQENLCTDTASEIAKKTYETEVRPLPRPFTKIKTTIVKSKIKKY